MTRNALVPVAATVVCVALLVSVLIASAATPAPACSIASLGTEYSVSITTSESVPTAVIDAAVGDVSERYPDAAVLGNATGTMASAQVPRVDGVRVVAVLFSSDAANRGGGPVGTEPQAYRVGCGAAVYDAATGELLVSFLHLEPAP